MKLWTLFFIFLSIFLINGYAFKSQESQLSFATSSLFSAYQSIAQISSKEFKNIGYAVDLLSNLTKQLVNSSQNTCDEYII